MPTTDVDGGDVSGQVGDLDRVQGSKGLVEPFFGVGFTEETPELLSAEVAGVLDLDRGTQRGHLGGGVGAGNLVPSGLLPPVFDLVGNFLEVLVFRRVHFG